jgi:hypothetical protein
MEPDIDHLNGPEAVEWLLANPNPHGFASEHFGRIQEAVAFVRRLYALGAERVEIDRRTIREEPARPWRPGGPYANCLLVVLPATGPEREALIWFLAVENSNRALGPGSCAEHFNPKHFLGRRVVGLGWR